MCQKYVNGGAEVACSRNGNSEWAPLQCRFECDWRIGFALQQHKSWHTGRFDQLRSPRSRVSTVPLPPRREIGEANKLEKYNRINNPIRSPLKSWAGFSVHCSHKISIVAFRVLVCFVINVAQMDDISQDVIGARKVMVLYFDTGVVDAKSGCSSRSEKRATPLRLTVLNISQCITKMN